MALSSSLSNPGTVFQIFQSDLNAATVLVGGLLQIMSRSHGLSFDRDVLSADIFLQVLK